LLSVVIPIYNEAARLRQTLEEVGRHLGATGQDFEIVCSDDGSTDGSPAIAREMAAELPLRLLVAPRNEGKGAAVVRGMLAASGDPVFFFDVDLSTPLAEIDRFLPFFTEDRADVVIGTRKHRDATIQRYQPWYRVWLGLGYTRLVHWMTGTRLSDYTCGFKAFRRAAAQEIFSRSRVHGWSFDAEILFLAHRLGYRIQEIPVTWADDPDSKVRLLRAISGSFVELLQIRLHQLRGHYR
jgi:dolichyl-phosphate beta-glucosyltransferase